MGRRRQVSVTPSPSPPPRPVKKRSPKREQVVLDRRDDGTGFLDRSPPRGGGKGGNAVPSRPPRGQVNDDSYQSEVNEGWLLDRVRLREKTPLGQWEIFPRSPTPKRDTAGPTKADMPLEMSKDEMKRNDKFQASLEKAIKDDEKAGKKKKKEGNEDEGGKKKKKDVNDDDEATKKKKKDTNDEEEATKKKKKDTNDEDEASKEKKDKKDKKEKAAKMDNPDGSGDGDEDSP